MDNQKMKKNLGFMTATSIVVGCVIGAGVFFKPYAIYQATGGAPGMGILAWIIGGLISLFAALTFSEVAILIPRTGGMVAYLGEAYDERVGFLAGWMQTVIFYPAFLAGYGVKVGSELSEYLGDQFKLPIALIVIAALVAINTLGSKQAGGMQVVATVCKLIPLVVLIIFGPKNLPKLGSALGKTVKNVREGMEGDDEEETEDEAAPKKKAKKIEAADEDGDIEDDE
jgi:APA family basic amino acid/polyamine antiporter